MSWGETPILRLLDGERAAGIFENLHRAKKIAITGLPVDGQPGYRDLFGAMEILEDPSRALTIEQAQNGRFAPAHNRYVGYTHSAYFVRVTVSNPAAEAAVWYLEPYRRI